MPHNFDDANLDHPWAAQYRIPLVESAYPSWRYEVALVVPSSAPGEPLPEFNAYEATWPTEEEARAVGSVIDFRRSYYRDHWQKGMLAEALDVDSSTNTLVLVKLERAWGCRWASWTHGPTFVSPQGGGADLSGLVELLDERFEHNSAWPLWKADHPAAFGLPAVA